MPPARLTDSSRSAFAPRVESRQRDHTCRALFFRAASRALGALAHLRIVLLLPEQSRHRAAGLAGGTGLFEIRARHCPDGTEDCLRRRPIDKRATGRAILRASIAGVWHARERRVECALRLGERAL